MFVLQHTLPIALLRSVQSMLRISVHETVPPLHHDTERQAVDLDSGFLNF